MNNQTHKYGILLLNMGGPGNLDEVEDYIYQLLADPDMIKMPLGSVLQKPFARIVSRRRAPKVKERYKLIGSKSPIGEETAAQSKKLGRHLQLPVEFAMRYTPPSADAAVDRLAAQGISRIIAIPLYPQYSTVSTLSSIKDLQRRIGNRMEYKIVDRHFDNKLYIEAMHTILRQVMDQVQPGLSSHLLFVAHSIPESYIRNGDPYADEVEKTADSIYGALDSDIPYSLAYQSRVGPVKWRGPTLDEELLQLLQRDIEQIIVQPLSFVSENLETLFDLDIEFKNSCENAGLKGFYRVPTLGCTPGYINALGALAHQAIDSWESVDA